MVSVSRAPALRWKISADDLRPHIQRPIEESPVRQEFPTVLARDIVALVMKQGMLPVGIGLLVGLPGALAMTPILKSQPVNVSPADPATLAVASATLVVSAALGCWIPSRRTMRIDPMVALRHE